MRAQGYGDHQTDVTRRFPRQRQGQALPWPQGKRPRSGSVHPPAWEGTWLLPPPDAYRVPDRETLLLPLFTPAQGIGRSQPTRGRRVHLSTPVPAPGAWGVWGLGGGAWAAPLSPAADSCQTSADASGFRAWGWEPQSRATGCPVCGSVQGRRDVHAWGRESQGRPETGGCHAVPEGRAARASAARSNLGGRLSALGACSGWPRPRALAPRDSL